MQRETDNRTFREIWNSLPREGQREMVKAFVKAEIVTDRHMCWWWGSGRKSPKQALIRKAIVKTMNSKLGYNVAQETLFP